MIIARILHWLRFILRTAVGGTTLGYVVGSAIVRGPAPVGSELPIGIADSRRRGSRRQARRIMQQGSVPSQDRHPADDAPPPPSKSTSDLDERMRLVPAAERPAVLVDHLAVRASSDGLDWIADLARSAEQYGLSVPELRRTATDLAWMARVAERRYPGALEWGVARGLSGSRTHWLVLAYVHGQRLRFDYRFREILARCNEWLTEFHDDALILSLVAPTITTSDSPRRSESTCWSASLPRGLTFPSYDAAPSRLVTMFARSQRSVGGYAYVLASSVTSTTSTVASAIRAGDDATEQTRHRARRHPQRSP